MWPEYTSCGDTGQRAKVLLSDTECRVLGMEFDCLKCGACCAQPTGESSYVFVRDHEKPAFDEDLLEGDELRTKIDERGRTVCIALDGEIGECVSCSVYSYRPSSCRTFAAGSPGCLLARASELEKIEE